MTAGSGNRRSAATRTASESRAPETEFAYLWRPSPTTTSGRPTRRDRHVRPAPPAAGYMGAMFADLDGAVHRDPPVPGQEARLLGHDPGHLGLPLRRRPRHVDRESRSRSTAFQLRDQLAGRQRAGRRGRADRVHARGRRGVGQKRRRTSAGIGCLPGRAQGGDRPPRETLVAAELERTDVVSWIVLKFGGSTARAAVPYQFPRDVHSVILLPLSEIAEVPKAKEPAKGAGAGPATGAGKGGATVEGGPAAGGPATGTDAGTGAGAGGGERSPVGPKSDVPGEAAFLPPSRKLEHRRAHVRAVPGRAELQGAGLDGLELEQQMTRITPPARSRRASSSATSSSTRPTRSARARSRSRSGTPATRRRYGRRRTAAGTSATSSSRPGRRRRS